MKRLAVIAALAGIIVLPFLLRPKQAALESAQDTLVVVTPHNEAIRHEFALGFERWYRARTGRTVAIDWRVLGGTSEIGRYLEGQYVAAFRDWWTSGLGRPWSMSVLTGFQSPNLPAGAPALEREAREAFLHSDVGCGIDVFFGGGAFDFNQQADAGRLWPSDVRARHPDWFTDAVIPQHYAGEEFWDPRDRWYGAVVSSYGIVYNRDALRRLGVSGPPRQWDDLASPRYLGEVALCDPTKSGSIAQAFENVIQQNMGRA
ncbi:MAG: ABC transporter substrate-binding protein, partial [Opitutaceae bacterium]